MDIDLLRTFVAICDTRSFTAAARRVGRTQSAVSLQVRRLEESLGRPLFFRSSTSVSLTEHGERLLVHAHGILEGVDRALVTFERGSEAGFVVIGLPDDYAPRVLDFMLRSTSELYPDLVIDLVIDESKTLVKFLADGSLDIGLVTEGEGPMRGGPVAFRDRLVWAGPTGGDLHLRDPLPVAIWGDNDAYSDAIFGVLGELRRDYKVVYVSHSMTGLRAAVTSGKAIAVMVGSSLTDGMRELTPADGFPPLREVTIRLERGHGKKSAMLDRLHAHLADRFASFEAGA